ncbi:hypothetical protein ACWF82_33515 [Nocardia sp. NPDC055053]
MTTTFAPPLVVLDTTDQELVVWQVNISPEPMVSRLTGAIAGIAHDWAEFEALRLSRPYLVQCGSPRIRPLPLEESR